VVFFLGREGKVDRWLLVTLAVLFAKHYFSTMIETECFLLSLAKLTKVKFRIYCFFLNNKEVFRELGISRGNTHFDCKQ